MGGNGGINVDVEDGQEVRHDIRIGEAGRDSYNNADPDQQLGREIRERARSEDEENPVPDRLVAPTAPIKQAGDPQPQPSAPPKAQWCTIEGQFVIDGDPPHVPMLKTARGEFPDDSLLVNAENKGIANVCIYLERAPSSVYPQVHVSANDKVAFDAQDDRFVPHILVAHTGQSVLLKNSNPYVINVHTQLRLNPAANIVISPNRDNGGLVTLSRSELKHPPSRVLSDLNPWMSAYWIVSDHPYVAVTDADGRFRIENLPAGEHTFRVWHERTGFLNPIPYQRDLKVNVEADKAVALPVFKLPPGEFIGAALADALETECSLEFEDTPLKDITEYVSKVHQVPTKLDASVDGTSPVTLKHKGTLKEMLEKVVEPLGLEYTADAKEIVIRQKKAEK
jgi:hypothetical protein